MRPWSHLQSLFCYVKGHIHKFHILGHGHFGGGHYSAYHTSLMWGIHNQCQGPWENMSMLRLVECLCRVSTSRSAGEIFTDPKDKHKWQVHSQKRWCLKFRTLVCLTWFQDLVLTKIKTLEENKSIFSSVGKRLWERERKMKIYTEHLFCVRWFVCIKDVGEYFYEVWAPGAGGLKE